MSLDRMTTLTPAQRKVAALKIKQVPDFTLPNLFHFNSKPCPDHSELTNGCRKCGISLRRHQRIAVAWLFAAQRGLVADPCGSGKTAVGAGLVALIRQAKELTRGERILVVCRSPAVPQWQVELQRMLPELNIITAIGTPKKRNEKYLDPWDIAVIGEKMLSKDLERLQQFKLKLLVIDDVDAIRHRANQTAYSVKRIAQETDRVAILTATPLQKRLLELYAILEVIGGRSVFGTEAQFKRRYVRRNGGKTTYDNLDEFKDLIAPMTLRRTTEQMDDVEMPEVSPPNNVFLELHPQQRERYEELRRGVLRIIREQGEEVKRAEAMARFTYGQQICAGLTALGEADGPGTSIKLDWVENKLVDGDLSDEKVVVFINNINTIKALQDRLKRGGVDFETIWGQDNKAENRLRSQQRFWDDPRCRVLMGTSAIEQSLNLQVSRHLINVDQLLNQARMTQLAGRVRRAGSMHKTIYIHNLFAADTQEDGYLTLLQREAALADFVWDESNDMYEALNPLDLLLLIGANSVGGRIGQYSQRA